MSDLKPCPFCGGEAEILTAESMHGGNLYGVMCANCAGRSDVYDTEAEAIAAWNSRADYHGYEQAAIEAWESVKAWNSRAERTCHIVKNSRKYVLSDGRELFDDGCSICNGYVGDGDNYCSNCGARVVNE